MITLYKLNFNGTWELQKPRKPDFIIFPPASDFTNLFQPPDLSGMNSETRPSTSAKRSWRCSNRSSRRSPRS